MASFDCSDLVCKTVTVYSDRAEIKRFVSTTVKVSIYGTVKSHVRYMGHTVSGVLEWTK